MTDTDRATPNRRLSPRARQRQETKERPVFYTRGNTSPSVSLWVNRAGASGAPDVDGVIDGASVALWRKTGDAGSFLSVHAAHPGADGRYPQLGRANVIVNPFGKIRLAINYLGRPQTIWASVSKDAPMDLLVHYGLKPERLEQRRAESEAARAAANQPKHENPGT